MNPEKQVTNHSPCLCLVLADLLVQAWLADFAERGVRSGTPFLRSLRTHQSLSGSSSDLRSLSSWPFRASTEHAPRGSKARSPITVVPVLRTRLDATKWRAPQELPEFWDRDRRTATTACRPKGAVTGGRPSVPDARRGRSRVSTARPERPTALSSNDPLLRPAPVLIFSIFPAQTFPSLTRSRRSRRAVSIASRCLCHLTRMCSVKPLQLCHMIVTVKILPWIISWNLSATQTPLPQIDGLSLLMKTITLSALAHQRTKRS
jgi:hypothetical protein